MKAPYQIKRTVVKHRVNPYQFIIVDTRTGKNVSLPVLARSPVPPKVLREIQAALNTKAVLK